MEVSSFLWVGNMSSDGRNPEAAGSDRQHPLKAMHIVETHPFLSPCFAWVAAWKVHAVLVETSDQSNYISMALSNLSSICKAFKGQLLIALVACGMWGFIASHKFIHRMQSTSMCNRTCWNTLENPCQRRQTSSPVMSGSRLWNSTNCGQTEQCSYHSPSSYLPYNLPFQISSINKWVQVVSSWYPSMSRELLSTTNPIRQTTLTGWTCRQVVGYFSFQLVEK